MSEYTPQLGDRVRVVLEGEVTYIYPTLIGVFDLDRNAIDPTSRLVVSVERLSDPLPTTPGSVVKLPGVGFALLDKAGRWVVKDGVCTSEYIDGLGWEPFHDAGATS